MTIARFAFRGKLRSKRSIYLKSGDNVPAVRNKNSFLDGGDTFHSKQAVLLAFGLPVLLLVLLPVCALFGSIRPGTLLNYLGDDLTQKALNLSVVSSLISTGLIVLFGTPLAVLMARGQHGKGERFLSGFFNLTIFLPPAVAGLALLLAFGQHGFLGQSPGKSVSGIAAVILAQCFVACPYYIKSAAASLSAVPSVLKDAASIEGASGFQILLKVTLPLVWRGCLAGASMSWARGLGEFGATLIFAGNIPGRTQTLPLAILGNVTEQRASVVAVVLLLVSFACLLLVQFLRRRGMLEPHIESARTTH